MTHWTLLTACALALLPTSATWAQKLRVEYADIELAPYQMGDGPGIPSKPGAIVELVKLVIQEMGMTAVIERAPQLRSFRRLQGGEIDGAFAYSYAPERMPYGRYPMKDGKPDEAARVFNQSYVFYRLKGSPFNWDGHTVSGLGEGTIGFNSTFSVGAELNRRGLKSESAKTTEQNFEKLAKGRITAYAMQELAGDSYLSKHPMSDVEKIAIPLETKAYYLVLSHQFVAQDPERAERLWARLGKLRQDKLPELLRKYAAATP